MDCRALHDQLWAGGRWSPPSCVVRWSYAGKGEGWQLVVGSRSGGRFSGAFQKESKVFLVGNAVILICCV